MPQTDIDLATQLNQVQSQIAVLRAEENQLLKAIAGDQEISDLIEVVGSLVNTTDALVERHSPRSRSSVKTAVELHGKLERARERVSAAPHLAEPVRQNLLQRIDESGNRMVQTVFAIPPTP